MSFDKAITIEDAKPVLEALTNTSSVKEVLVFGSVARDGRGNDLDVILVVEMYVYISLLKGMWQEMQCSYCGDSYADFCDQRNSIITRELPTTPAEFGWIGSTIAALPAGIDLHVVPEGWRNHLDEIQQHLPHDDSRFMSNIARDARDLRVHDDDHCVKRVRGLGFC